MEITANFRPNLSLFLENYINIEHTVLGARLAPFCVLHLLWLESIESPLFQTSERATLSDLEIAVLICSSRSSEEILAKLKPVGRIARFRKSLWHWRNKRRPLRAEAQAFIEYQFDTFSLPEYSDAKDGGESNPVFPWQLIHIAALAKATGWAQEYILTLPLGQVFWLNDALSYLETGRTRIVSDKEKAAYAALDQMRKLTEGK